LRWFATIGGLLVLVLLVALAAPLFVNFDDYRTRFEAEASRILGQPVTVQGHISAQLIPFPSITLNDVQVGDEEAPLMRASSLALFAELAPFLSGQIRIFDAQLDDPVLQLDLTEGWSPKGTLELPGLPAGVEVELENATISNGRILVRDAVNAQTWTVEISQAEVSANSLAGPWRVNASTIVQARRVDASFTIGQISAGAEMVSLFGDLQFVDELTKLRIEGAVDLTQNGQFYDGTFTLGPVGELATPYRIDGDFDVYADRVLIDTLTGNFGDLNNPYVVRGNAELIGGVEPSYAIEVTGNQFGVAQGTVEQTGNVGDAGTSGRIARIVDALRTLPIPAELPGTIKLDLPAVVIGGTIIRDLLLDARPNDTAGWEVRRLTAELPGRTALELSGDLRLPLQGEPLASGAFKGSVLVASLQPTGLARWIAGDSGERVRALPRAGVEALIDATIERQLFDISELRIGVSVLSGSLERRSPGVGAPALLAELDGDSVSLASLAAIAEIFGARTNGSWVADHQIEADLKLTKPDLWGVVPQTVELSLRPRDLGIEIDKFLVTDMEGVSLAATGTLGSAQEGRRQLELDMDLTAADATQAVGFLATRWPDNEAVAVFVDRAALVPDVLRDLSINISGQMQIAGEQVDGYALEATGRVAQLDVSGAATFDTDLGIDSFESSMSLGGEGQGQPLLSWLTGSPLASFDAPRDGLAEIEMSGSFAETFDAQGSIKLGSDSIDLETSTSRLPTVEGFQQVVSGEFDISVTDASPYDAALPILPLALFDGLSASAKGSFDVDADTLTLSGVEGQIADSAFSLRNYAVTGDEAIKADVQLTSIDIPSALLDGESLLSTLAGWSQSAIDVAYTAETISLDGQPILVGAFGDFAASIVSGTLFADVIVDKAGIVGGGETRFQLQTQLSAEVGTQFSVNGQATNADLHTLAGVFAPQSLADLSMTATGVGLNWDDAFANAKGSGSIALRDIPFRGLNVEALPQIIRESDAVGFEIDEDDIRVISDQAIVDPQSVQLVDTVETPFLLDDGLARFSNVRIAWPQASLTLNGSVNPVERRADIDGTINFATPDDLDDLLPTAVELSGVLSAGVPPIWQIDDHAILVTSVRQRAIENEQRRIEALQARLLDRQRVRRLLRIERARLAAIQQAEEEAAAQRAREEEEARLRAEEEARARAEAEAEAARQVELERQAERERLRQLELERSEQAVTREPLPDIGSNPKPPASEPAPKPRPQPQQPTLNFDLLNPDVIIEPLGQ